MNSCLRSKMKIISCALLGLWLLVSLVLSVPTTQQVRSAISRAQKMNALRDELSEFHKRNLEEPASAFGCPLARFHARRPQEDSTQDKRSSDVMVAARILLQEGFTAHDLKNEAVLQEFSRQLGDLCPTPTVVCDADDTYRTPDGSCNNQQQTTWGMAGLSQRRMMAPAYDDGIGMPRAHGIDGSSLPNPRTVSNEVHRGERGPEVRSDTITLQVFQMGQFLDHDIIATPIQGAVEDCCANNNDVDNCLNINFDQRDEFNRRFQAGYCMGVPRSAAVFCSDTTTDAIVRQQTNELTSYIDASNVYGSSLEEQLGLRDGAFMKTAEGGTRLPDHPNNDACHSDPDNGIFCSLAGDFRVNVVPSLTAYHNVFVLEHNRIANELRAITDDETLFQETRKVIIGIMQKIVYDEFLPSFISPAAMSHFNLSSDATYTYDPTLDATISNEFGMAYRMGHTWIPRDMSLFGRDLRPFLRMETDEVFFDPALTYVRGDPAGMEGLAYWLTGANSPETDGIVEDVVRNNLFVDEASDTSFDLAALNINRGRDHGIPSYNEYRKHCGLSPVETWGNSVALNGLINHDLNVIAQLERAGYANPQDIDLFTGALTELPVSGSSVGPTMECILGEQFRRLKFGDRYWYQGAAAGFNDNQIAAIRSYTMSKLMCENYNFDRINHPSAFLSTDQRTRCTDINPLNTNVFLPADLTTTTTTTTTTRRPPPDNGGGGGGGGGGAPPPPPNGGGGGGGGGRRPGRQRELDALLERLIEELEKDT